MKIDLSKVDDQYCSVCKKKKTKYIGKLLGENAVFFQANCSCSNGGYRKLGKSDESHFNDLQVPFWKLMGQKPKAKDIALEKYLHDKGMNYGDWRRKREHGLATNPSALNEFERHYNKYGRNNAPDQAFNKNG